MAADNNFVKPANKIVWANRAPIREELIVETATSMYPGRLAKYGSSVKEQIVNDGVSLIAGWLGYDNVSEIYKKDSVDTIYTQYDHAEVLSGGGFGIVGALAANFAATKGDVLIPWSAGCVAPAIKLPAGWAIKVPYTKKTSAYDTGIDFIAHMLIGLPEVLPVVADASGTIDIGMGDSGSGQEAGYDADGLVDGLTLPTAATWGVHNMADGTAANITAGVLLQEVQLKDANTVYAQVMKTPALECNGTLVSLEYTTSNHTQSGYFYVPVTSPGTYPVGIAKQTVAASTSIQDILLASLI